MDPDPQSSLSPRSQLSQSQPAPALALSPFTKYCCEALSPYDPPVSLSEPFPPALPSVPVPPFTGPAAYPGLLLPRTLGAPSRLLLSPARRSGSSADARRVAANNSTASASRLAEPVVPTVSVSTAQTFVPVSVPPAFQPRSPAAASVLDVTSATACASAADNDAARTVAAPTARTGPNPHRENWHPAWPRAGCGECAVPRPSPSRCPSIARPGWSSPR